MKKGFAKRWMDVYPRPRKRSGAYMTGSAYDVHPYVLINYNDDYESVSTVAHEWGHAMHSYLSNKAQPFPTSRYAIFVAEIASTFNEALLLEHMLKSPKSDDERLLYLGTALESLRGTFFRQAMFAEFERDGPRARRQGRAADRRQAHQDLRRASCAATTATSEGVVKIDDLYAVEWALHPALLLRVLRLPVRHLDRGELALRRGDPQGRARRAGALPRSCSRRAARTIRTSW